MTTIRAEEIPKFRGPQPAVSQSVRRRAHGRPWAITRRQFLKAATAAGVGAGMAMLGVFPSARRALANHEGSQGYQIYTPNNQFTCDGIPSGSGTCAEPCGPSTIHSGACDPDGHKIGWHKDHTHWKLRQDECDGNTGLDPGADGWKWQVNNCEGCGTARFRCHDGKHIHADGMVHKSICKWRIACF
ncbi:MAG: twin-arginine translocation signal domain-containing protein [bacterium]